MSPGVNPAGPLILLVGAESTGKSTLGRALAQEYGWQFQPELLRSWVERHGRVPTRDEQHDLFADQVALERDLVGPVILDCGPLMTAVYSQIYYGDDSLVGRAVEHHDTYAAALWCDIDLPWVPDPGMRDGEAMRVAGHDALRSIVETHPQVAATTTLVSGSGEARVAAARAALVAAGLAA